MIPSGMLLLSIAMITLAFVVGWVRGVAIVIDRGRLVFDRKLSSKNEWKFVLQDDGLTIHVTCSRGGCAELYMRTTIPIDSLDKLFLEWARERDAARFDAARKAKP